VALYENAVSMARGYLGPAAQKFIDRQISTHLNIKGTDLAPQHLEELARWCYTSGKLVIDDGKAKEFADKVKALK